MKVDILGVKVNTETKEDILRQIKIALDNEKSTFIVTPYSETLVAAQKDEAFRNILNAADFALPDGVGVSWAVRFLHSTSPVLAAPSPGLKRIEERSKLILNRMPGREFFWDLCQLAESRGESVFLLGGFGDTPDLVAVKLKEKFPNLRIAGTYAPDFSHCHCEAGRPKQSQHQGDCRASLAMTDKINSLQADFLFVALGPFAQERWIYQNLPNLLIKLAMGVGGTFDYIAGKTPLPPQFLSSRGLEWLWRLLTQPWRAWRITKGVLGLIWYTLKARM